jgi:hypothetical protein
MEATITHVSSASKVKASDWRANDSLYGKVRGDQEKDEVQDGSAESRAESNELGGYYKPCCNIDTAGKVLPEWVAG